MNPRDQEWRDIAEQASTEMDREKLALLVAQLCSALDRRQGTAMDSPSVGPLGPEVGALLAKNNPMSDALALLSPRRGHKTI